MDESSSEIFKLISSAEKGQDITVRDDQYSFNFLIDVVKICRKHGGRFRLVDSGVIERFQVEWLGLSGADIYTSDETGRDIQEIEFINKACQKENSIMAFFFHGEWNSDEDKSFSDMKNLCRDGIYFHVSNREKKREAAQLVQIAHFCRKAGSWLVHYHHGPLEEYLTELARNGAWIHVSDKSLQQEQDISVFLEIIRAAQKADISAVLHYEKGLVFQSIQDIAKAGAYIQFKANYLDYRSSSRTLDNLIRKGDLDFRAYYLNPAVFP